MHTYICVKQIKKTVDRTDMKCLAVLPLANWNQTRLSVTAGYAPNDTSPFILLSHQRTSVPRDSPFESEVSQGSGMLVISLCHLSPKESASIFVAQR